MLVVAAVAAAAAGEVAGVVGFAAEFAVVVGSAAGFAPVIGRETCPLGRAPSRSGFSGGAQKQKAAQKAAQSSFCVSGPADQFGC